MTRATQLLVFVGAECSHCRRMEPEIALVERSTGAAFERFEVWHNAENAAVMRRYAEKLRAACGGMLGVPAFYPPSPKATGFPVDEGEARVSRRSPASAGRSRIVPSASARFRRSTDATGLPVELYNEQTGEALCGEVDEETLRAWAAKGTS